MWSERFFTQEFGFFFPRSFVLGTKVQLWQKKPRYDCLLAELGVIWVPAVSLADRSRRTACPSGWQDMSAQSVHHCPPHTQSLQLSFHTSGALWVSSPGAGNTTSHKIVFRSLGQTNLKCSGKKIKLVKLICCVWPGSPIPSSATESKRTWFFPSEDQVLETFFKQKLFPFDHLRNNSFIG